MQVFQASSGKLQAASRRQGLNVILLRPDFFSENVVKDLHPIKSTPGDSSPESIRDQNDD
jgi:hypothetical protein